MKRISMMLKEYIKQLSFEGEIQQFWTVQPPSGLKNNKNLITIIVNNSKY